MNDVHEALTTSGPEDWHLVEPSFPTYLDNQQDLVDLEGRRQMAGHDQIAVWRPDVRLRLAWGMPEVGFPDPEIQGEGNAMWAPFVPDRTVRSFLVDVLHSGALIDRYVGARIDGGRGLLPWPRPSPVADANEYLDQERPPPPLPWVVTRRHHDVLRLVHQLVHGTADAFDQLFGRAQVLVDDEPATGQ